jgi:hypothetical protein
MGIVKAYLDNDVVSAIAKDDNAAESAALTRLLEAHDEGKVILVTSKVTLEEIKRYQGPLRPPVERTFRLLEKVPIVQHDELLGFHSYGDARTWIAHPLIQNNPLFDNLLKLGLETVDARHVFVAAKNGCHAFLTCDRGILRHRTAIQQLCGLVVQKPSDFVASQGW